MVIDAYMPSSCGLTFRSCHCPVVGERRGAVSQPRPGHDNSIVSATTPARHHDIDNLR
jgi:hypothetical protein